MFFIGPGMHNSLSIICKRFIYRLLLLLLLLLLRLSLVLSVIGRNRRLRRAKHGQASGAISPFLTALRISMAMAKLNPPFPTSSASRPCFH
jgi:hypothetical protein